MFINCNISITKAYSILIIHKVDTITNKNLQHKCRLRFNTI